jgi:hypothetical protein
MTYKMTHFEVYFAQKSVASEKLPYCFYINKYVCVCVCVWGGGEFLNFQIHIKMQSKIPSLHSRFFSETNFTWNSSCGTRHNHISFKTNSSYNFCYPDKPPKLIRRVFYRNTWWKHAHKYITLIILFYCWICLNNLTETKLTQMISAVQRDMNSQADV